MHLALQQIAFYKCSCTNLYDIDSFLPPSKLEVFAAASTTRMRQKWCRVTFKHRLRLGSVIPSHCFSLSLSLLTLRAPPATMSCRSLGCMVKPCVRVPGQKPKLGTQLIARIKCQTCERTSFQMTQVPAFVAFSRNGLDTSCPVVPCMNSWTIEIVRENKWLLF